MKKISLFILFFVSLIFAKAQNIGIGESNFTPDGSSILEIKSTSKGLLIPRMTKDQRDAIVNPAFGLVIFQIDNNPGIYFNSGTSFVPTWDKIVIEEEITDMHQAVTITGQDYLVLTGQQITAQLINLGAHVTGVLPLTKGGTGATTAADARTNLGLGNSAVLNVGTTAGTVAAGDHAHANYASSSHTHATHTRGTGLTGSNYDGSSATTWAVDFAGSGTATTVSRSDHNHTGTYDNYANWKLQGSGLNESNVTSGTTINITGSGATTVTKSGNTVTISSTDNNSTYTASNGITLNVANFELTGQALALHNLATNGLIVRTGSGTVNGRTITWSGNGGSITNGDGVAGNPTISLNIGTGATQVAAGNHTHDAADVITGEFNRARVRRMTSADTRGTNPDPQTYEPAIQADFKQNTTDGLADGGTYHGVVSFRPYGSTTDFSGGQMHQMGFTDNGNLWMRKSTGIASWGSWQKLLTSTDIGTISGTQNYISKFTSSNSLGNSLLFDNGTSIGIGTATPGATNKLDISYTTGSSGGKGINVSISGNASWSSPDIGLSSSVANSNASLGYGVYGQSTSSSASSGRNWGIYGYAHNGGTNVGTAGYVTSTSGNNAGILGVLNGYESFDVATTMSGSWAGFFSGPVKTTGQFTSSLATGTSPFNVTSTTVNTNLNADLLDGNHASAFQTALTNPVTGTGSSGHVSYWNGATTQTYDSDGNFFWDATNNRLGIGTTGPSYKLDVSGDIRSTGKIYANANGTSYFRGGDDAELWDVNIANTIGIYGVQNSDRATIRLGSGGSDISGLNGNVGIGTTSPTRPLQIQKTASGPALMIGGGFSGQPRIQVYGLDSDGNAWMGLGTDMGGSSYEHSIYFPTTGPGRLTFGDYNGTTYNTRMTVLANGNVGIGVTAPSENLEVSGNIKTSGIVYWGNGLVRTESRDNAGLQGDAGAKSGFYETSTPTPASSWPNGATSWWHMMDVRHSNNSNNYAMQFAGSFFDQKLYFRKTNNNASQAWSQVVTAPIGTNTGLNSAWSLTGNFSYSPDDVTGASPTSLTGDEARATYTMPFSVIIDGISYSSITICTNGWISFSDPGSNRLSNSALPSSSFTAPTIFPYWDDLTTVGNAIRYFYTGTSPNRAVVVDFECKTWSGDYPVRFQVTIHEGSGLINVQYRDTMDPAANGQNATIGFQLDGGANAKSYPIIYNGKILDDNRDNNSGWSIAPVR